MAQDDDRPVSSRSDGGHDRGEHDQEHEHETSAIRRSPDRQRSPRRAATTRPMGRRDDQRRSRAHRKPAGLEGEHVGRDRREIEGRAWRRGRRGPMPVASIRTTPTRMRPIASHGRRRGGGRSAPRGRTRRGASRARGRRVTGRAPVRAIWTAVYSEHDDEQPAQDPDVDPVRDAATPTDAPTNTPSAIGPATNGSISSRSR